MNNNNKEKCSDATSLQRSCWTDLFTQNDDRFLKKGTELTEEHKTGGVIS